MRIHAPARRLAVALLLALPALPAAALNLELQVGRSYTGSFNYGANAAFIEGVFDAHYFGDSAWSWSPDVLGGWINGRDLADHFHDGYSMKDQIWLGAAGVRFHYGRDGDWYQPLFFSFQPVYHSGRTPALSSGYEFASTIGWQAKHWNIEVRHISNGGIHDPNLGETMALVGIGFDP